MDRVNSLATKNAVVIFSRSTCYMCHAIKTFFYGLGVSPAVHEIDRDSRGREMERALLSLGCNPSVPAVFIGGEFIGSTDEVMTRHVKGLLIPLLKEAGAIWL